MNRGRREEEGGRVEHLAAPSPSLDSLTVQQFLEPMVGGKRNLRMPRSGCHVRKRGQRLALCARQDKHSTLPLD